MNRLAELLLSVSPLPCPFCGRSIILRQGEHEATLDVTYILCGVTDDGSDGCGAIVSFRPRLSGRAAVTAWNRRTAPERKA